MKKFAKCIFLASFCIVFFTLLPAGAEHFTEIMLPGTPYATDVCVNTSAVPGPAVLILGGVHGNEPAGSLAAQSLCRLEIMRGILIVMPRVNRLALELRVRTLQEIGDINRAYPGNDGDTPAHQIAKAIVEVADRNSVALVIDLHEARTFHRLDRTSLGQTILFASNMRSTELAMDAVDAINACIAAPHRKFSLVAHPVRGSAAEYFGRNPQTAAFTIETSSQQTPEERTQQHAFLAKFFLRREGLLQ